MKKWVKKCETSRFHRPRAESIESAVIFDPCRVRPRLLGRKMPGFRASAAQDCVETHTKGAPPPPPPTPAHTSAWSAMTTMRAWCVPISDTRIPSLALTRRPRAF
eukprot:31187-Pelagococcus_subviridis.AAC.1